ncbi:peptide/nickel transport system permease protein [Monaibacterium marinum]|uniref:Peptide/nickel transport system permease protein n=1 Tax=Pontivivens marinum TaxID=1690039 RepID=A0A2C9CVH8_9RHOB|nr:ABC transporter permease [Monaibacterium marinum]SOH95277.1 peptide/nickel transport system permease protein [Monaibacterium marinum]
MVYFILKRLFQSIFVMLAVAFLSFSLFRFVGDPVSQMTGVETTVEDRERLREELGLNDPFLFQFARFTGDLLQGDFGYSYRTRQPVAEMIADRIPATLELGTVALIISLLVGIPAGVYTALNPRGFVTQSILLTTLVGVSIPTFVIGIMLIFLFGVQLGWLPTFGRGGTVQIGGWTSSLFTVEGWRALILPAFTLGVYQLTLTMRLVRAEMMEVMRSDYILFATARGIPWRRLHFRHALANTMVPVITIIGLQFGGVIAFSIVTESVFQWPGMGLLFLESIRFVDIPVMGVYLVVIAFFFVLVNLAVDLLYIAIDPRLRVKEAA